MEEIKLCEYGCGQEARYQLKNEKWCCSKRPSCCIFQRKQQSERLKSAYKNGRKRAMTGIKPWSFGKKMTNEFCQKVSNALKGKKRKPLITEVEIQKETERRRKISEFAKKNSTGNYGGYKKGSGRGKKGWYKGYWCDSSWELAWVIYNLDHDIKFERNTDRFEYEFEGKIHKYLPDFKLIDGRYIEVKGWLTEQSKKKIESCDGVVLLAKEEMKPILEYVISKYGKDFIDFYDENISQKFQDCSCGKRLGKLNKSGKCLSCAMKDSHNIKGNKKTKDVKYCKCGKKISWKNKSGLCKSCAFIGKNRKVLRPNEEVLKEQIKEFGYCGTARIYGVSDSAIHKWEKLLAKE